MNSQDYNALENHQELGKERNEKRYLTVALLIDYEKPKFISCWPQTNKTSSLFPLSLITDIYIYILLKIRGSGNPK